MASPTTPTLNQPSAPASGRPQAACPQCGNAVDPAKPCPFCAYADSIGVPTDHAVKGEGGLQVSLDLSLLSGFLRSRFQIQKCAEEGFEPGMLETMLAQKLAKTLLGLHDSESKQEAWDPNIVRGKLRSKGLLTVTLDGFMNQVLTVPEPSLEQLLTYLKLVKNKYAVRVLKGLGDDVARFTGQVTSEDRNEIEKFTAKAVEQLRTIQKLSVNRRIGLVKAEMQGIIQDFEYRQKHGPREILGYSIKPFNVLNQTFSGLRNGFLYAFAGAPRRGKTNLVLDIATYLARNNKIPVLFFTYEQTKRNLTYRLLSKESYINPDTLQRKQVLSDPLQKAKLAAGLKRMSEYQDWLFIVEATKDDTIERVRGHAYNVMQEFDTNNICIFIDYIQKMPASHTIDNEKVRVEEVSTALKGLSIELNCPIVAISSLSKEGCAIDQVNSEQRPTMYHCKGSGDIEYDLDAAGVLAKDWADTAELNEQLRHKAEAMGKDVHRIPKIDIMNLHIEKNRDAPEGVLSCIQFFFFIEENKFIELGYKLDADVYRFNKIESLVNTLVEKEFIKFYDAEAGRGPTSARDFNWDEQQGTEAAPASASASASDPTKTQPPATNGGPKKIRLKY